MTALQELEEPALKNNIADRITCRFKKPNQLLPHEQLRAGTLYRYLDLDHLLDAFIVRLKASVPVETLSFKNQQLGQSIDKHYKASRNATAHQLEYKLVDSRGYLGQLLITRRQQFLSAEVRRVNAMVEVLVGPLRNASMYWRACQSAYLDSLTGVPNRAALEAALSRANNSGNTPGATALMVCDVDRFKAINDNCGHQTGDEVLRQFAGILSSRTRKTDLVYRYGGDEFVIVLADKSVVGATDFAEQIRRAISDTTLYVENACINLTTTIGLTGLRSSESLDEAFLRADEALLIGKKSGKNKVVYR